MSAADEFEEVVDAQLASLDASDALASVWATCVAEAEANGTRISWGGRGRGGRGAGRSTFQPHDVVVDGVCLEFLNDASVTGEGAGGSKTLLQDATIKLLSGKVYSLVGRNGVGKSSLLKRIDAGKVPGFPPHITTLLVSQEVFGHDDMTPIDVVLKNHREMKRQSAAANAMRIKDLEEKIDGLDMESEEDQARMEVLCEEISRLEGDSDDDEDDTVGTEAKAREALHFFGVPESMHFMPTSNLSGGIRKKISLACGLVSRARLLLLDEPTCHLDLGGIIQLRRLIADYVLSKATVILISHDIDLLNDISTDTIHFANHQLTYYPGNYRDFMGYRKQGITHALKQSNALEKQRAAMVKSIDNLKKKSSAADCRAAKKKIGKQIENKKKKLERHGVEKNEHGHRRTVQKDGGIRKGAINGVDASTRNGMTHKQLLKQAAVDIGPVPDKAVQFDFRDPASTWGDEPLVSVMDVGHRYGDSKRSMFDVGVESSLEQNNGLLFDCVDLSVREGARITVLGENGSGKTSLLSIVAGEMAPTEGTVHFATGLTTAYFGQHSADELIGAALDGNIGGIITPLSLLTNFFPKKTEHTLRAELTAFGLSPKQANTNVRFLSGGERCRLSMATMMLRDPQLLVIDEITNHLDVESVEALIYGINRWKGTLVMASHDVNFIRQIAENECFVLLEGHLRRIDGGIDTYLRSFNKSR